MLSNVKAEKKNQNNFLQMELQIDLKLTGQIEKIFRKKCNNLVQ